MSEANRFTPGPWYAVFWDKSVASVPWWSVECHMPDCLTICPTRDVYEVGEAEANAHLIAAAPDLLALAVAYERWEADLILCSAAWPDGGLPQFTQELYDRWMDLQAMRNAAVAKARGGAA